MPKARKRKYKVKIYAGEIVPYKFNAEGEKREFKERI